MTDKETDNITNTEETKDLYFFYSQGCAFCKQLEPIVDELNKEGYSILKLDIAESDNKGLKQELQDKYKKGCGTPWLINPETGNDVCGWREKDIIKKWADGKVVPPPPQPKSPPPKPPFHGATKKEEKKWKKEFTEWAEENSHLPNLQTAEQILERPRPKTEPPKPPPVSATDEELEEWGKIYTKWTEENSHLPNLHATARVIDNLKERRGHAEAIQSERNEGKSTELDKRIDTLEQKLDKLMQHLGVK